MSFQRIRRQMTERGLQAATTIVQEGRNRVDAETIAKVQVAAKTAGAKAVVTISEHMPNAQTVQSQISRLSDDQMEAIVRHAMKNMSPTAKSELGQVMSQAVRASSNISPPPGITRGDPAAIAAGLSDLLKDPGGAAKVMEIFTMIGRADPNGLIGLAGSPVARQFLSRFASGLLRPR